ncbi:hypothetical protein DIPPA_12116 [Diplonema papillatum]|nr:hypothetical protein DIPPA_12116 [Diplonema papillatum]
MMGRAMVALCVAAFASRAHGACAGAACPADRVCQVDENGQAGCFKPCATQCGALVPHGWAGHGDGAHSCNLCACLYGTLQCTAKLCPPAACPAGLCTGKPRCALGEPSACPENHVCAAESDGGGAGGCCVFDACRVTPCGPGRACRLDAAGQPECVCCSEPPACPAGYAEVDEGACLPADFSGRVCVEVAQCCSKIVCRADPGPVAAVNAG